MRKSRFKPIRRLQWWVNKQYPIPAPDDQETRTEIVIKVRKAVVVAYVWMLVITLAGLLAFRDFNGHYDTTVRQARVACERSMEVGPDLAQDYERRGVLKGKVLKVYIETIPKHCN